MQPTESETLFEQFCASRGIRCVRVPRESARTSDYRLVVAAGEVVAEVKQLDPNEDDRLIAREFAERRSVRQTVVRCYVPGARVRQQIVRARGQLKRLAKGRHPALLVLYDNTGGRSGHIDAHDVLTAMYGEETHAFGVVGDPALDGAYLGHRFGGKRQTTPRDNTTLSAIAVLRGYAGVRLGLDVFHNCFAAIPLPPDWLRGEAVRHFALPQSVTAEFREWGEL